MLKAGVVVHVCYANTREAAARRLCPEGHPALSSKNLS